MVEIAGDKLIPTVFYNYFVLFLSWNITSANAKNAVSENLKDQNSITKLH